MRGLALQAIRGHVYIEIAADFLKSMKDFPPSQTPGSFNLQKIEEQLRRGTGG
jgi:arylsulfatase